MENRAISRNRLNLITQRILQKSHVFRRNRYIRFIYIYTAQVFYFTKYKNSGLLFRRQFVKELDSDCIFDIGANIGQFRTDIRSVSKNVKIVSFEPVEKNYSLLKNLESRDANFYAIALGIGKPGEYKINVASNGGLSSSIYTSEKHSALHQQVDFKKTERINVISLTQAIEKYAGCSSRVFLKIDVQGAENDVLQDLKFVYRSISAIIVETSYTNLYSSGSTFYETIQLLNECNFEVVYIENLGKKRKASGFHYCDVYAINKDFQI